MRSRPRCNLDHSGSVAAMTSAAAVACEIWRLRASDTAGVQEAASVSGNVGSLVVSGELNAVGVAALMAAVMDW